ncbi:MAG TPA: hypothetical protein VMV05_05945 [bacterium]|nr:hypothetical protein [bacterium]
MAQILIRGLEKKTVNQLKKRAKADGKSLQSEAKAILEDAAKVDPEAFLNWARRFRGKLKRQTTDSADLIREDRDR